MKVKKESSSSQILWGFLSICGAVLLYYELSKLEASGGTMTVNVIIAVLYNLFGKNVAVGFFAALGFFITISGILDFKNDKKVKAIEEEENKSEFISFSDEKFEIIRKLSDEEIDYFETLNLKIKESQIYQQYWTDFLDYENEDDENWLNISKYFWKADEPFYNTSLPEDFKHYQHLKFTFVDDNIKENLKIEKLYGIVEKFHFEEENRVISIRELLERGLIAYCKIVDLAYESINDIKHYQSDFFFAITNPKITSLNNELYIGENKISIELAYAVGGIELVRTLPTKETNKKYETKKLLNQAEMLSSTSQNSEYAVKKTSSIETTMVANHVFTTTTKKIDYSNYVPDVENKQLYFETIILLMNFIQHNDKSIDITKNKFYILALENSNSIKDFTGDELENRIFENAKKCFVEFTDAQLGYLVRNSVNVLKGKFAIDSDITNLYYKLFGVFEFRTITHEVYFYSLLE